MSVEGAKIFTGTEVVWSFKEMPNGETRISALFPGGTRRITTIASGEGGWQVGHFHKGISEEYSVEKGFMVLAYLCPFKKRETWRPVLKGDKVLIPPPEPHNVWLSPGAVITTVQSGKPVGNPFKEGRDWYLAPPGFDKWCEKKATRLIRRFMEVAIIPR